MEADLSTCPQTDAYNIVSVLLPLPLKAPYDYLAPKNMPVELGSYVEVPLGSRYAKGVVWGCAQGGVDSKKLREISALVDLPPMPESLRRFVEWVAKYTLARRGSVLRMTMSVPRALEPPRMTRAYLLANGVDAEIESLPGGTRLTPARRRVLIALSDSGPRKAKDIARDAKTSISVIRGMADIGALQPISVQEDKPIDHPDPERAGAVLSDVQAAAAVELVAAVEEGYSVRLLDGVTGSGKTEVYFEAIAAALRADKQVIVLLPEIALTAECLDRFRKRFGTRPILWHSDLPMSERRRNWRAALRGEAKLVVGARSALMLPYRDLGLIIIDEEHDPSFKQNEGVTYNARDMAIVRAYIGNFPIILSSATPSLETVDNVWRGRYQRIKLPERFAGASLPKIRAIDMRREKMDRQNWLSPSLERAVGDTMSSGEQVMLFLNRRGYAPLTLCRVCGHRLECPQCSAWLVEHRLRERLHCHHCGYNVPPPKTCPSCEVEDRFAACGPGVERLAEEAREKFPKARLEIMSSDTIAGPTDAMGLVTRMREGEIDLLIGTQIMAKGFHFPLLTLVGVVDADLGLSGGDLRAAERTYQLLHQVSGRAGRAERPGVVLLQTFQPDHPIMLALQDGDRDQFIEMEAKARKQHNMPPYGRLTAIIVSGRDQYRVDKTATALARTAPRVDGVSVLGPAPAPIAIVRGRHRRRLLLKAEKGINVQELLRRWVFSIKPDGGVRVAVDIDPYSFM
ncbi:MAG: Primosomal protein N' [Alphaproteobacteria bacterium MarineAlpha11_Bin1]|nr:MAG: Primosomal protein N' [Alphaproteobacteria bacterium MarineAlpha11_Bin1]|tara:strand:+ start:1292 stop:3514 length:2223 start_codon:yes stop_codon:yes gene_type:complete